jgi:type I restriction enzyme R subunit
VVSEADTRANYIDPALKAANWQSSNIIREHYFTDGRKLAGGTRGRRCFVDYLLHKDNGCSSFKTTPCFTAHYLNLPIKAIF